jgi:hypothetical protein
MDSAGIALIAVGGFALLLVLLHFLKPENDPSWRMISEYEIGRWGWLMRLAFFCWSVSYFALAVALWHQVLFVDEVLLFVIAVGALGAAVFAPDPITTPQGSRTRANELHALSGVLVIFGLPITATIIDWNVGGNPLVASIQPYLPWMSVVVWLGFGVFAGAMVFFGAKKIPLGPQAKIGWPNRFMVFTYVAWLILIALAVKS